MIFLEDFQDNQGASSLSGADVRVVLPRSEGLSCAYCNGMLIVGPLSAFSTLSLKIFIAGSNGLVELTPWYTVMGKTLLLGERHTSSIFWYFAKRMNWNRAKQVILVLVAER